MSDPSIMLADIAPENLPPNTIDNSDFAVDNTVDLDHTIGTILVYNTDPSDGNNYLSLTNRSLNTDTVKFEIPNDCLKDGSTYRFSAKLRHTYGAEIPFNVGLYIDTASGLRYKNHTTSFVSVPSDAWTTITATENFDASISNDGINGVDVDNIIKAYVYIEHDVLPDNATPDIDIDDIYFAEIKESEGSVNPPDTDPDLPDVKPSGPRVAGLAQPRLLNDAEFTGYKNIIVKPPMIELSIEDLNNIIEAGIDYYGRSGNSVMNKPPGVDGFGMKVIKAGYLSVYQELIDQITGKQYTRVYDGGTWTEWSGSYTTTNKPLPDDIVGGLKLGPYPTYINDTYVPKVAVQVPTKHQASASTPST